MCGYHGWQDWYIGSTTRHLGVPAATRKLTHKFLYNDLTLERPAPTMAGTICSGDSEPMNTRWPQAGFLEGVKALADQHGALLVFDETITGFRYAKWGAQELFKVTPDLATFGKGMANGYPVSALAGKAKIMRLMEEIFFSFTFGGETLSLAAAGATLSKLRRKPVIQTLKRQGEKIIKGVEQRIARLGLNDILSISGHPSWSFLVLKMSADIHNMTLRHYLCRKR